MRATKRVIVHLNDAQHAAVKRRAAFAHLPMSTLARVALLDEVGWCETCESEKCRCDAEGIDVLVH